MSEAAPGEDISPALALVNTRRRRRGVDVDTVSTGAALRDWLAERQLGTASIATAELVRFHRLRASIRELFLARIEHRAPADADRAEIDAAAASAPGYDTLVWTEDATPQRAWIWLGGQGLDRAAAELAADAITTVTEYGDRLAACPAPGCVRFLLRTHRRRYWCGTQCGDRVRAARHYNRTTDRHPGSTGGAHTTDDH